MTDPAPPPPPGPPGGTPPPPRWAPPTDPAAGRSPTADGGQGVGWYNGPLPVAGLVPRETIGAAIGRTAVKSITALFVLLVGLILAPIALFAILATIGGAAEGDPSTPSRTRVAGEAGAEVKLVAVPVTGLILGEDRGQASSLFGALDVTFGYSVKEELEDLAADDRVDGIILEVDSPGGTIFGSRAIADGVAAYRELSGGKPVVAHVGGISASGGVYAMAGADTIYADHGTLIGSIGVIFGPFERYDGVIAVDGGLLGGGVTTEGGIEVEYLTAGRGKDLGNPYRPMTTEERAVLQEGLDLAYADFVGHVSESRDLTEAEIEKELGALLFAEQQAVANGLIDGVANRDDAYRLAAEAAGLADGEDWSVERLDTPSIGLLDLLVGATDDGAGDGADGGAGDGGAGGVDASLGATHPLCLGSGTILAYHGDPTRLCLWGR